MSLRSDLQLDRPAATSSRPASPAIGMWRLLTSYKDLVRGIVPLRGRKLLAVALAHQRWLSARHWWIHELLHDYADRDPNGYHRFLWKHHVCYAETYEVGLRFGPEQIHPTRKLLFDELKTCLAALKVAESDVSSVFEVGSSLGYNLRYLETELFSTAGVLEGCDIDTYAVQRGGEYLRECGSRVRLLRADMGALDEHLSGRVYDVTVCAGVLMYLNFDEAREVVASLLRHTRRIVAFAGLADPGCDNATLETSGIRREDRSFIHNIDRMVVEAGGVVLRRHWEGGKMLDGNTVYFVFAAPAAV